MVRSAAKKVLWVGRATVFFVGLAVILALIFGVATTALGANLDNFILGKASNSATKVTGLVTNAAQSALLVRNNGPGSALDLKVTDPDTSNPALKDVAPMKVDSQAEVANLNAEFAGTADDALHADTADSAADAGTLDGLDSIALQRRVSLACDPGSSIRAIDADGTPTCEPDDDTSAEQVNNLRTELGTNDGASNEETDPVSFSKVKNIDSNILSRNAETLDNRDSTSFANRLHTHAGTDITSGRVEADFIEDGVGSNLNADQIDGVELISLQRRVTASCPAGSSIRAIGADGTTLTCEPDDDSGAAQVTALRNELGTNDGTPNQLSGPVSFNKVKDIPSNVVNRDADTLDGLNSTEFQRSNAAAGGDLTGSYPNPQIAPGAVSGGLSGKIDDNTITDADISDSNGVRGGATDEIVNDSVDQNDIATHGVTADEMATLPAVKALSSNIPITNDTHTVIPLTLEQFDQVGAGQTFGFTEMHSNTTENYQFVAPREGIYEVQVEVIWDASSTGATGAGERRITLRKNWAGGPCGEGSFDDMDVQYADPGDGITSHISTLLSMDPGSNAFFCGYQTSGEPLNIRFVFASMHYVSAK